MGPLAAGDAGRYAGLAAALAIVVGLLCLADRIVGLGALADLLSKPLLVGYVAGIADPVEWFILNAEANVGVDLTALDALDELREELTGRGIVMALARVKQDWREDLDAAGFLDRLGPARIFMTLPTAVAAYARWYTEAHGTPPQGMADPPPTRPAR